MDTGGYDAVVGRNVEQPMAELWEGLRQRQDVVFGDDNEITILGCQGASLSLLSPCGQRIFSKGGPILLGCITSWCSSS